ncbi:MAG: ankyrin repeat family protein [Acidimicrobiales bacterium]|nr:ankyrin repeat family protein [Acidimicrobiales bacterium]
MYIAADDPLVVNFTSALQGGELAKVRSMLADHPELATARFGEAEGMSRTALHAATDWPGHFPHVADVIRLLVEAGADVDGRFAGPHRETPLHWAASSDDVEALDALLDLGADIEAHGGVLTDGPPLDDAVIFAQWKAAQRLVERGARVRLFHAAALGLTDRARELLAEPHTTDEITSGLWHACRAGHPEVTALLLEAGGDPLWEGWEEMTPLLAAQRSGNAEVAAIVEEAAAAHG